MAAGDRVAAYVPDLDRSARALAAVALVTAAAELVLARDVAISVVFVIAGLLVGLGLGRAFARVLYDKCEDVPELEEGRPVEDAGPSRLAVAGLAVVALAALAIPALYGTPTPLPAFCAAGAVQALLAVRAIRAIERIRNGRIVRPTGRILFEEQDLRLAPGGPQPVIERGVGSPTIHSSPRAASPRDGGARGG